MRKKIMARCGATIALLAALTATPVWGVEINEYQDEFEQAMQDRAEGRLYDALENFHNIISNQPQLQRARLELAVTYYRLYEMEEAQRYAQEVLDDPKTPPEVQVTILAFLAQVKKDAEKLQIRHTWKPSASLGWMHDTNVNVGPANEIIDIGPGILYLTPGAGATSDSAVVLSAGLSHLYQSGKKIKTGQTNTHFLWQSNINYYHRDYFNEHAFDMGVLTMGTGPMFLNVGHWRVACPVQVDYIGLGSEDLAWFSSFLPSVNKQIPKWGLDIGLSGQITNRDYTDSADQVRDSTYAAGKFTFAKVWKKAHLVMTTGISFFNDDADSNRYSNDGRDAFVGATWAPIEGGSLYGRFNERHVDYDGPEPIFGDRYDREEKITLGLSYHFQHEKLKPYTFKIDYSRTDNYSSAAIYAYDREQFTCSLGGRF